MRRYEGAEYEIPRRDSDIIRMELRGNYYILLVHHPIKEENNLFIISADKVNAVENIEKNISEILGNKGEFEKIGGLTLAEGHQEIPLYS